MITKISSDILEKEQSSLKIFYRLERCEEGKSQTDENNWKTIIAENSDRDVTNWEKTPSAENYWSYYDTCLLYTSSDQKLCSR